MIMIVIIRKNRNFHIAILNHPDIPSENKQTRYFDMEISTTKNCIKTLRDSGQILESQKRKKSRENLSTSLKYKICYVNKYLFR